MTKIIAVVLVSLLAAPSSVRGQSPMAGDGQSNGSPAVQAAAVGHDFSRDLLATTDSGPIGPLRRSATLEAARLAKSFEGQSSQQKRGGHPVLIGTVVGAVAGLFVGMAAANCAHDGEECVPAAWGFSGIGAGIGAGVGAIIRVARP